MRTLITLCAILLLSSGCMKQALGGLGLGDFGERPVEVIKACPTNVVSDYARVKLTNTDPSLKSQYETTFNCKMDGVM